MRLFSLVIVLVCSFTLPTLAMFMRMDKEVPLDKVIPQLKKNIEENPKDAHGYYLLGRVHSLAWAMGGDQVQLIPAGGDEKLPTFPAYASVRVERQNQEPADEEALKHLDESIASYRKAVDLAPEDGLYRLGLAWMLEQKLATNSEKNDKKPADRSAELKEVIDQYVKAFDLRLKHDISTEDRLMAGDTFVSLEAANNAIRLLKTTDKPDPELIARLEAGSKKVMEQPMAITPVIIAMDAGMKFEDLIDNKASVGFDLAGLGTKHRWPWVTDRAGVLVWDPSRTGLITSGRQLFGNMTWQMLFRDGYEALATLDADRNGQLTGKELNGISVWVDRNQNAVSDSGEVIPAADAGIKSINVRAKPDAHNMLTIEKGVTWKDGRVTASYDWVPQSK